MYAGSVRPTLSSFFFANSAYLTLTDKSSGGCGRKHKVKILLCLGLISADVQQLCGVIIRGFKIMGLRPYL